jgi:hypothetical protein
MDKPHRGVRVISTMFDLSGIDQGFDALSYGFAYASAATTPQGVAGEINLWCAVLAQAFIDAGIIHGGTAPANAKHGLPMGQARQRTAEAALAWLLEDMRDFPAVCTLAGVSPQVIRSAAKT